MSQRGGWLEAWAPLGSVPTEDSGDGLSTEMCVGVSKDLGDTFATGFFPRTWLQDAHPPGASFGRLQGVFLFLMQTEQAGLLTSIQVPVQEVCAQQAPGIPQHPLRLCCKTVDPTTALGAGF